MTKEQLSQLPIHVPMGDGSAHIVYVPHMTAAGFAVFRHLLDIYEGTIVYLPPPAEAEAEEGLNESMTEKRIAKVENWLRIQRTQPTRFCAVDDVDDAIWMAAALRAERKRADDWCNAYDRLWASIERAVLAAAQCTPVPPLLARVKAEPEKG